MTFPRLPDCQYAYALVERDDGVRYRLYGGTAGPQLPHDIRHLVAERELRITDGVWAGIAAGVVLASMQHVSGRRPPHAAEVSQQLIRKFAGPWLRGFGNWNLVLFFVLLLGAGVLLSVPIGFAFGLATLAYLATLTHTPLTVVVSVLVVPALVAVNVAV